MNCKLLLVLISFVAFQNLSAVWQYSYEPEDVVLRGAAQNGVIETMEKSLREGANIDSKDIHGNSALHLASIYCQKAAVKLLLERRCQIDIRDAEGRTPLMVATRCENEVIIELLLKAGCNPMKKDDKGWTAREYAELRHQNVAWVFRK